MFQDLTNFCNVGTVSSDNNSFLIMAFSYFKTLAWHSYCFLPLGLNASMLCFSFSYSHIFLAPFSLRSVYYLLEESRESGWYGQWLTTMAARRGVTEGMARGRCMEATRAPVECFFFYAIVVTLRYATLQASE